MNDQPSRSGCNVCGKPVRTRKDGQWICAKCFRKWKHHAPRDVGELRNGTYVCGFCFREVTHFINPRSIWLHLDDVPEEDR